MSINIVMVIFGRIVNNNNLKTIHNLHKNIYNRRLFYLTVIRYVDFLFFFLNLYA